MVYKIITTKQFDKDYKRCAKRGYNMALLQEAMLLLKENGELPPQYKPHLLSGNHKGQWECHIRPDWLLIWEQNEEELILLFLSTGTHSDLF